MSFRTQAEAIREKIVEYRRHVHMYPELGLKEFETAKYIKSKLSALGIEYKTCTETGVTVKIDGNLEGSKTLLIRADIDALPLQEDNDAVYKSTIDGVMHACGHDTHVACLLGAAELLKNNKDKFGGSALLVFQPAEEGPGGAKPMVEAGAVGDPKNPDIHGALALHVSNDPVTKIVIMNGVTSAAADELYVTIKGKGGHGSAPHNSVDPVYISGLIMVALQGYLSRLADPMEPMVLTIGKIEGGDRNNIISETASMEGTLRTMSRELREKLHKAIPEFIKTTAKAHGAEAEVEIVVGYDVGINDAGMNNFVKEAFHENYPDYKIDEKDKGMLGAEDFYEFGLGNSIPITMFGLGGGNEEKGFVGDNHSNYFDIDEDCLAIGTATLVATAVKFLNNK
ncbi:MAG: amidohydrolase [Candidatus Heimdallarchaeota archaeon]|nr:amidohydrolase [Candidatus Heimdallarchaeota archaeon]